MADAATIAERTGHGDAATRQRVVVVVGAGRSGTSALTRGIGALGVALGDNLKPGTRKNAKGFFEDEDFIAINYRLRDVFGFKRSGAGARRVPEDWFDRPEVAPIRAAAAEVIRTRFADTPLWGFKAGGVLSFLPFWERVFADTGQDPSYVLALRNPLSVARSRAKVSLRRGIQENSDLEFLARVVPYFRLAARHPLAVVDYDRLLADAGAELRRVAGLLDLPLTTAVESQVEAYAGEFLSPELRHHATTEAELRADPRLNPLARDAYLLLAAVARGAEGLDSEAFWDAWARIERAHAEMAPVLRHIDALEAEIRRSRQGVLGFPLLLRDLLRKRRERTKAG